jgi:outer membrane protein
MKAVILYVILVCFWAEVSCAQKQLSLDDCISLAFKHSTQIKNAVLDLEASKDLKRESFTKYFPKVNLSGVSYVANTEIFATELVPGMEVSFFKKGTMGGITAMQPIYAGGLIKNSNKLASIQVETKKLMLEYTEDEVQRTVEQYYLQYVSLYKKMETLHTLENLIQNTRRDVEGLVKSGVTTTNSLLEVELKENEIASCKLQVNNGLKHLKMLLGQQIGMNIDEFVIADWAYEELVSPEKYKVNHESALYRTVTYQLNENNVKMANLQTKLERSKYMPSLAIGVGYWSHNLFSQWNSFGLIHATVSIPILQWWGGSHAIKRKRKEEKIVRLNMENTKELLLIQMQRIYDDLIVAYGQVEISQKSIDTASEHVRINAECFKVGTITLTTLLESQSILQRAHDQYVEKYTEYLMKLSEYKRLTRNYNQ